MSYRAHLPQLDGGLFLTDGGIETTLIFHEGLDLPAFAAFVLLRDERGTEALRRYYAPYAELAREHWCRLRAREPDLEGEPALGPRDRLRRGRARPAEPQGDRPDGGAQGALRGESRTRGHQRLRGAPRRRLQPGRQADGAAAQDYHATQIATFADTAADMVTAITMTYVDEAIGITRAAVEAGLPVAISFTLETDGRLPSGQALGEAIRQVDEETGAGAAYFMINCAHPTHFGDALAGPEPWHDRIRGLRANASTKSHAELDEATELDEGDPADLGARYAGLRTTLPELSVLGGCCGTDHRHVGEVCRAWLADRA